MANSNENLDDLDKIPQPTKEPDPQPDEFTREERREIKKAKAHANLKQKELLALELNRNRELLEQELAIEREERKVLQDTLNSLAPECEALRHVTQFDRGITTWAAVGAILGNAMVGGAGFLGKYPAFQSAVFIVGLTLNVLSSFLILGVHRLWIPKKTS